MKFRLDVLVITGVLCYLSNSYTEAVAPRSRSRFQSRHQTSLDQAREAARQAWLAKARRTNPDSIGQGSVMIDGMRGRLAPTRPKTHRFRPSLTRCCKIGEKTAKKEMSCNMDEHAVKRQGNIVHKAKLTMFTREPDTVSTNRATKEFASRIAACAASKFNANFEKCCRYRESFMKELDACSKDMRGPEKKKCRQAVRKRYP